jgi:hypothetical protein
MHEHSTNDRYIQVNSRSVHDRLCQCAVVSRRIIQINGLSALRCFRRAGEGNGASRAATALAERRAVARIEATRLGLDIRFIVTNLDDGSPEWLYATLYCARGQAENLIKLHKAQLASDRTSCRSALANQVRLVLHTAAYWLMLAVRDAIPKSRDLAKAEFATLRLRLLKIAARVVEMASRVRLAFAAACPEAELFASLPAVLMPSGP